MPEALYVYADATPVQVGLCYFVLGVVLGSFSSVLAYRLPRGLSIVRPRSFCPHCSTPLKPLDLIPVLTFVFLRGRCRYCGERMSWLYPARELMCGLLAAAGGAAFGWSGGSLVLAAWVLGHVVHGLGRREGRNESGSILVEVLVSIFLLGLVAGPAFQAIKVARISQLYTKRQAIMIGLAREGLANASFQARNLSAGQNLVVPPWCYSAEASCPPDPSDTGFHEQYQVSTQATQVAGQSSWVVTITVQCTNCREADLQHPPIVLSGVVSSDVQVVQDPVPSP